MARSLFGTAGVRRVYTNYTNNDVMLTPAMALDLGLALGTYLNRTIPQGNTYTATVVIGKDIRMCALPIEHALISGLVSVGCKVKTVGIVTTPTLTMSLQFLNADSGICITASHNTPDYIGLKFWNPDGMGYTPEQEEQIEVIYNSKDFVHKSWWEVGKVTPVNDINDIHINDVMDRIQFDGKDMHVIVDPGNGSSCEIVPKLLGKYNVNTMTINSQMDGHFPGRHSEPSKENLQQISKFLQISTQEDIGIALDGDADRVIFLDENGEIVDPIRLLALMAKYYLKKYKGNKLSEENLKVVTPINSSSLLEATLNPLGCKVVRTEVGDIKVAHALKKCNGFVGGENSGTYIWPKTHYGPDSIVTIAKVLQMITETGKSLKKLLDDIPNYPFYRRNFKLKKDIPFTEEINQNIINEMNFVFENLNKEILRINKMDGCRFDYNGGWILIRRSGTSPYLRISGESTISTEESIKINKAAELKMIGLDLIY